MAKKKTHSPNSTADKAPMKDGTGMRHMLPENVEINLMYLMAYAIWFLADDAERRMAAKSTGLHFQQKQRFNRMMEHLRGVKQQHDLLFEDYVTAWGNKASNYDGEQFNANLVARLLLLFYDRVLCNGKRENEVFKLLRSFPEEDITEEVLKRFYMQKLQP